MKKIKILAVMLSIALPAALQAHSDAFKPKFVDTLVDPYLAIQQGLAGDDLSAAQLGAGKFLEAMKGAPHEGEAHMEAADLSAPAKVIGETTEIKAARKAFLDLSREVSSLVEHVGTTGDAPLYLAKCPMAFDNKGGIWMQSGKTISNPYYGSMMQRCGSVQKQVSGKSGDDHGNKSHGSATEGHAGKGSGAAKADGHESKGGHAGHAH